jgi:hypothetical protein
MRHFGIRLFVLAACGLLWGCGPGRNAQPGSPVGGTTAASWDGTYRGTIEITGLGSGIQRSWCETVPQIVVQVANNAFRYEMPHPNAPDNPTPVYVATIAPEGTFTSQIGSGTMTGRVTGLRMSGNISGSVCVYAFSMDRS